MSMEILLIRHGKTDGNLRGAYIGSTDEPLCAAGREELAEYQAAGIYPPAATVAASNMLRCLQTAELLYPGQPVIQIPDFRECHFGAFEGMNYRQLNGNPDYQRWIDNSGAIPFPGGEDPIRFRVRCWNAFQNLCAQRFPDPVAVVCHGGTIMAILEQCASPKGDFYRWQTKNGAGYRFWFDSSSGRAADLHTLGGDN